MHTAAGGGSGRPPVRTRTQRGRRRPQGAALSALVPPTRTGTDTGWNLTGREAERDVLIDAVAGSGPSVVISGAAGLGRTRLAREALAVAREAGRATQWVTGTSAAAAVPLGAMAHLIPPSRTALDPFALLQRAMSAIADQGGDRPLVVAIDDAHLLDQLSLTLVEQLVTSSSVTFVITLRPGDPVSNQLARLWKDGAATRLELHPLARPDFDRLVAAALAGMVDSRTAERLWRLTRGHPLFLRELVEGGQAAGHLRPRGGLWRWVGEMRPTPRLVEIVLAQLDRTETAERAALDVVATGEPLLLEQLLELSTSDAVVALERRGLVAVDRAGRREARMGHPLYAEVVRDQMPEAAASRIRRQLTQRQTRARTDDELSRLGRLAAEGDETELDVELVLEAAVRANAGSDHQLAERLARTAVDAGAGVTAHLALLESVQWQGRHTEAEELAAAATALVGSDEDRSRLAMLRAINLFCGLGRRDDAESVLAGAAPGVTDAGARDLVVATRAFLASRSGLAQHAVELGGNLASGTDRRALAQPLAAAAVAAGLAMIGRNDAALATAERGNAALVRTPAGPGHSVVRLALAQGELGALQCAGRLTELERRAETLHARAMASPESAGDAVAALFMAIAAQETGHLRKAVRWLTEAFAGFDRCDPMGLLPWCAAQLIQAHALLGDPPGDGELARVVSHRGPTTEEFEPQLLLAQAWRAADESRRSEAARYAQEAARVAADRGQWAIEAGMLHAAARLGRAAEVAKRLRRLAEQVEGRLSDAYAEHVEALLADSGPLLDEVATSFEDIGALLLAADARASAATAHGRAGARRDSSTSAVAAARLARDCDVPRTPALDQLAPPRLTSREEEVAHLAVVGLNNSDIAERLFLSVRTVETHLAHVYTKLGIRSRAQLVDTMAPVNSMLFPGR
jgi:DNA-binding CsgD family transcriptional regulator